MFEPCENIPGVFFLVVAEHIHQVGYGGLLAPRDDDRTEELILGQLLDDGALHLAGETPFLQNMFIIQVLTGRDGQGIVLIHAADGRYG